MIGLPVRVIPIASLALIGLLSAAGAAESSQPAQFEAALIAFADVSPVRLSELRAAGYRTIVLPLEDGSTEPPVAVAPVIQAIVSSGLQPAYWIEVGRCPRLAAAHPEWMSSLQGHPEWRRLYPEFPQPGPDEVVKAWPWVPVLYAEAAEAHFDRVRLLTTALPPVGIWFVNDLQAGPSACGCGNPVCRWTTDYGPIATATRLGPDAPAQFVARIRELAPAGTEVVPVWTTECEEHDRQKPGLCYGVGCYRGQCWDAYCEQLQSLSAGSHRIGALLLHKEFRQDGPAFSEPAGWVGHAIRHGFDTQPQRHENPSVAADRIIAVVQGWDVSAAELQHARQQARTAGAAGCVTALTPIDQSWTPKLVRWR